MQCKSYHTFCGHPQHCFNGCPVFTGIGRGISAGGSIRAARPCSASWYAPSLSVSGVPGASVSSKSRQHASSSSGTARGWSAKSSWSERTGANASDVQ